MESLIQLYDSDIFKIEDVLRKVNARQGTRMEVDAFVREVEDRFATEAGLKVEVVTFEDIDEPGFFAFNFVIRDRIETDPFDHERMAHEVQHDILGLSTPGKLTPDGVLLSPGKVTSMSKPKDTPPVK
jgi:hypothetical protein